MTATLDHTGSGGWLPPGGPFGEHPVAVCVAALEAALGAVGDGCCWGLSDAGVVDLLARTHTVSSAVEAVRLRLVAEADRRETATGAVATSTAAWLAATERISRREAARQVRLAADLDTRFDQVRAGLADGRLNAEQVQVIVAALRRLPTDVGAEQRAVAEGWLVQQAASFGPDDLARLGRRVFEVIAPQAADEREGRLLEAEEARARPRPGCGCTPTATAPPAAGSASPTPRPTCSTPRWTRCCPRAGRAPRPEHRPRPGSIRTWTRPGCPTTTAAGWRSAS